MATSFLALAECAEGIGSVSKRLDKAARVAAFCAPLSDVDLTWAMRFLAGQIFAGWDKRTLSLGQATLIGALAETCACEVTALKQALVVQGDLGSVAACLWPNATILTTDDGALTLQGVAQALEAMTLLRGAAAKRAALTHLWAHVTALEAKYLVRLLSGELRCGLKEGALEDALSRMAQQDIAAVKRASMLLGDIGETALSCRHKTLGDVVMRLFHPLKCMLASPADDAAHAVTQMPALFAAEDKYDGVRAQAHIARIDAVSGAQHLRGVRVGDVQVALFSRTQDDMTEAFPDLWAPLAALCAAPERHSLVLDAEIIAVTDDDASASFAKLQTRLGRKAPEPAVQAATPVRLVAFDALLVHDRILLDAPLTARRAQLCALRDTPEFRVAPQALLKDAESLDTAFAAARARGNEGLVVKDPSSPYSPGRRGRQWLKLKRTLANLDVVITAAEVGHGRRHKWLSDYTFAVRTSDTDSALCNIGKAYSGLTDLEIAALTTELRAHTVATFAHGKVVQVTPRVVLEVTFEKVQVSPRHKGGFALRFPRIVRLRPDKPVSEIATLADVAKLAE